MKTRITDLFGCKYPILQGAMAGLGDWKFAAAAASAGAHGTITASVSRTPERLREDIKRCKDSTDGTFGVNLSFGLCPRIEEMLEVCIQEDVPVETAMYKPDSLAARIKESGLKWIHKSARVKDAPHAERLGVDAQIVVGLEGTGFKSPEQMPTMTTITWATRHLKTPFIAAGGIADAGGFLGALAMGADGVMMGTAFMLTRECALKDSIKEQVLRSIPEDPRFLRRILGSPDPKAYAEVVAMRDRVPLDRWLKMLEAVNLKDEDWKTHSYQAEEGPVSASDPTRLVSLALAAIDHIPTVRELVDGIVSGAEEGLRRLGAL